MLSSSSGKDFSICFSETFARGSLVIVIGIAIFAVQNSSAPLITMKFLFWRFETSLIYTIFGSVIVGIVISLFFWIPKTMRASIRSKELNKQIENLERVL